MQLKAILLSFLISFLAFGQNADTDGTEIIQKTLAGISSYHTEKAVESFEYKTYTKGIVQTQNKKSLELIASPSNFLFEEAAHFYFDQNRPTQKTVIGSTLPGFESPFYPLFSKTFHPLSIYENQYEILGKPFHGPLSKNALKHYSFELRETITNSEHPYHIIYFSPKNNREGSKLNGELYIDTKTFAVQKAVINHSQNLEAEITHHFRFYEIENLWFPVETQLQASRLNNNESFNLFGKRIPSGRLEIDENDMTSFSVVTTYFDVILNGTASDSKNQYNVVANITENNIDDNFRSENQIKALTEEEKAIVASAYETVTSKRIEKRIQRLADFSLGYVQLGFFDLDLKFLIKYNNYEGIRSGLGGVTNDRLSPHFNVGGYLVRGFKDEAYKYQLSTSINLIRESGTRLNLSYTDDITEMGSHSYLTDSRTFSLFEPRLVNIVEFFKHKSFETSIQHTISPQFNTEVELSQSNINQILDYEFLNEGTLFSDYQLTRAKASVLWSPYGKFIQTPYGITEYHTGYPRFSAQFTQSFKGLLDGNFNFSKVDVRADYLIKHLNRSNTELILEGNVGFGNIPLTHMYHAYPNSPNKETILSRFSVAGIKSFETMYFGEFFSDKLATIHIKHRLKPFIIASWFKPELALITRHAIGTASNLESHQNISFNTLEKGYSESGLEINQLFFGFGVSLAYRYGAYQLPQFEDNVSFKFTFYLKI